MCFDILGLILVTDCFHGLQSHKSCPSSFNLAYWKEAISEHEWNNTNEVNTSAAKQLNAKLRNLEKHIRCTKMSNYIEWTKKFFEFHNIFQKRLVSKEHTEYKFNE